MCTGGSRHLEDFICLVLVRKIPWDANEGASHGTLSKTGLFFFLLLVSLHHYTLYCIRFANVTLKQLLIYRYSALYIHSKLFWLIQVFLAMFVINFIIMHICGLITTLPKNMEYIVFFYLSYNSLEYPVLIGQLHHPAVIFIIVYGNAVLYINPLIQAVTETATIFNFLVSHHRLTLIFILFYFILLYWDDVYFEIKWHVCMPLFGFRDLVESGSLKSQPDVVCIHIREKRRWNIPS